MRIIQLLACLLLIHPACRASWTVAVRGQAAAVTIVRPAGASASQIHAAEELQAFTEQMTGVKLPVVTDEGPLPERAILLGDTRHTAQVLGGPADLAGLGEDGFRLKTEGNHLLILGGPVRGTLYGVYELLERHGGCRWYTSWHQVIPRLEEWTLPDLDDTQRPAFAMREVFWFDMFNGDLAARNRVNGNRMQLDEKHGGKIRFGGGLFVHTFERLCPVDEFFASHPEYFSEIDGKRRAGRTQLCLTNPDVLRIVTERLLERIRKDPGAKLFSVSQNDWANFCTCANCRAVDEREESHAGTMIEFVNRVAEAVEKEFPDVWIETLAYQYTRKPPKTVRPRHNVVPRLCSIECDFSAPLARSAYEQNKTFAQEIRGWSAITDKLYVWDYTTNFAHYLAPFPNVLSLQENVQLFRDNHVVGLFEQGAYEGRHADFAELKAWLLAKWLWNPNLPAGSLLDDFFTGYYGAAAPFVRAYFDEVHTFHGAPAAPLRIFDRADDPVIPAEFLQRATTLWQNAAAAVKDSPAHAYNVRMGEIPVLYARLQRLPPADQKTVWVTEHPEGFGVAPERRELSRALLGRFDEAGNVRIREYRDGHEKMLRDLLDWAAPTKPLTIKPRRKVMVEDRLLTLNRPGEWGGQAADPAAGDGSAIRLFNSHYEWCLTLPFRDVAFDAGATYRLRMRVRVEPEPGREGEAFWAGVYDPTGRKSHGGAERKVAEVGLEYAWYDVAEWVPERDHYFWIGPGRFDLKGGATSAIRAVFVDCLEIERIPSLQAAPTQQRPGGPPPKD